MEFSETYTGRIDEIIDLFRSSFTVSEGAAEGALIGRLAKDMITTLDSEDMFVFSAIKGDRIVGAILFTRLSYPQDDRTVFILAPVAVAPAHQGKGVGQGLLRYGLDRLRDYKVDVALTYGDIRFYAKTGFAQITEQLAQAPLPLEHPEGWLGQSLTQSPLSPLNGPSHCVTPLDDPAYW